MEELTRDAARDAAREELSRREYSDAQPPLVVRLVGRALRWVGELLDDAAGAVPEFERLRANYPAVMQFHTALGQAQLAAGDTRAALETLERARNLAPRNVPVTVRYGEALLQAGRPKRAHEVLRDVAADAIALGDIELSIDLVDTSAAIWAGLGRAEKAATLLGVAEEQRQLAGIPRPAPDQRHLDRFLEPARQSIPDQAWAVARTRGSLLTIEEAIAQATADSPMSATAGP